MLLSCRYGDHADLFIHPIQTGDVPQPARIFWTETLGGTFCAMESHTRHSESMPNLLNFFISHTMKLIYDTYDVWIFWLGPSKTLESQWMMKVKNGCPPKKKDTSIIYLLLPCFGMSQSITEQTYTRWAPTSHKWGYNFYKQRSFYTTTLISKGVPAIATCSP